MYVYRLIERRRQAKLSFLGFLELGRATSKTSLKVYTLLLSWLGQIHPCETVEYAANTSYIRSISLLRIVVRFVTNYITNRVGKDQLN